MANTVHRYKWYLVGVLKPEQYTTGSSCDTIDTPSRRFVIYDHSDSWCDSFASCIEEGKKYWSTTSYPDSLGCHLVVHVEVFCQYAN